MRVSYAVLAHRPKEHPGELSMSTTANHEQIGSAGRLCQNRSCVSLDDS